MFHFSIILKVGVKKIIGVWTASCGTGWQPLVVVGDERSSLIKTEDCICDTLLSAVKICNTYGV
jgi:hypothetical protein